MITSVSMRPRLTFLACALLAIFLFSTGCNSVFEDLRSSDQIGNQGRGGMLLPSDDENPSEGVVVFETSAEGFAGLSGYRAEGSASIVDLNGELQLQFSEDFSVSNGPGLEVILTERTDLAGGIQPELGDVNLGALASNRGAQVFQIPGERRPWVRVFIYCQPFDVPFGFAVIQPL